MVMWRHDRPKYKSDSVLGLMDLYLESARSPVLPATDIPQSPGGNVCADILCSYWPELSSGLRFTLNVMTPLLLGQSLCGFPV